MPPDPAAFGRRLFHLIVTHFPGYANIFLQKSEKFLRNFPKGPEIRRENLPHAFHTASTGPVSSLPSVISHATQPIPRAAVYPSRRSPRQTPKLCSSQAQTKTGANSRSPSRGCRRDKGFSRSHRTPSPAPKAVPTRKRRAATAGGVIPAAGAASPPEPGVPHRPAPTPCPQWPHFLPPGTGP